MAVSTQVVTYQVDESTVISFEIVPPPGFRPAGANEIAGKVREAVGPAVEGPRLSWTRCGKPARTRLR